MPSDKLPSYVLRFDPPRVPHFLRELAKKHEGLTRRFLTKRITLNTRRLIIYLTPGQPLRAGGIIQIGEMYQESIALQDIHKAKVALCNVPGEPLTLQHNWYDNDQYILELTSVLRAARRLDYLLLHIPAYAVNQVVAWLESVEPELLQRVRDLHLNIMVMNIDNIQGKDISGLKRFGTVTCTTGHESYSNLRTREALGIPLHRLLARDGAEFYPRTTYYEKDPLLMVSPDAHQLRELVLPIIASHFPELKIQVVKDLSFGEYMKVASRAKWSLTFGEGLDNYFVAPFFCGGVSFAVFNERYFTESFATHETIYPSWEALIERLPADLKRLDEPNAYNRCSQRMYDLLCDNISLERFRENLRSFYRGEYTFP